LTLDGGDLLTSHPFIRRLDGPKSWSGSFEKDKNVLPQPASDLQTIQPVA